MPRDPHSLGFWKPLFVKALARLKPAPKKTRLRVGQGLHVVFLDHEENPFVVSIVPPEEDGLHRSEQTTVRFLGDEADFGEIQRAWFAGVVRAVSMVERVPQWAGFVRWAADRPGVSLPNQEARNRKMTSGMSVLIRLNEPCNAACDFCSCIGVMPDRVLSVEDARQRLQQAWDEGVTGVSFTGGEPTLYPDLLEVIAVANSIGFEEIQLQTNGTRLDEPDFADAIVDAGLQGIFLSLHHHEAGVHDRILRLEGSFERAIRAADNMLERGAHVTFNHVICDENHRDPHRFVAFVQERYQQRTIVNFSYVSPIGRALEHLHVVPRISTVRPQLSSALDFALEHKMNVRVAGLCGIPMCQLPDHLDVMEEFYEASPPELVTRTHFPACEACEVRSRCSGYWKHYVDQHGAEEFQPVTLGDRVLPLGPSEPSPPGG